MATIAEALAVAAHYHQHGHLREAEQILRQIVQADPQHIAAWRHLSHIYLAAGRFDDAAECDRRAAKQHPNSAEVLFCQANALRDGGRLDEALAAYEEVVRLKPDCAEAYNGQGIVLARQGKLDEATLRLQHAIRLVPHYISALINLGHVSRGQGKTEESLRYYEEVLRLEPTSAQVRFYRAQNWLAQGDFERGWPEFEWRWKWRGLPPYPCPPWDGSPLAGRTLMVNQEGGFGDAIHLIRYAPWIKERGGRVLLVCFASLIPLLRNCPGVDELIPIGSPLPRLDTYIMMQSLPFLFRTTLATVPANVPYLFPNRELVDHWREAIRAACHESVATGFQPVGTGKLETCRHMLKIGIAWQANPQVGTDMDREEARRFRAIPLALFAPLAELENVRLFSLQKQSAPEQLADFAARRPIVDLGTRFNDFADTAAAISNLDLVISVDTAVAHCAGALGIPVWMVLWSPADWRWMRDREDSPWYPTMRLFRQKSQGDWEEVMARVACEVQKWCAKLTGERGALAP